MPTYVAFLRAINLGAKRKFPKDAIKAATEAAGGSDVETYINTGNVRLTHSARSVAKVQAALEEAYAAAAGFEVPTIVFTEGQREGHRDGGDGCQRLHRSNVHVQTIGPFDRDRDHGSTRRAVADAPAQPFLRRGRLAFGSVLEPPCSIVSSWVSWPSVLAVRVNVVSGSAGLIRWRATALA